MFSKISFRHLCSHRKLAGLAQLVHDSSLRVVLYLRPRRVSVRENHPHPPPRGKATRIRKRGKNKGSLIWCFLLMGKLLVVRFLVWVLLFGVFPTRPQIFFICFFASSSTKRHRKYPPFIWFRWWGLCKCNFDRKITGMFLRILTICYYEDPI